MGNISSRQRHGLRSNNIFGLNWSLDHQKLLRDVLPAYFQDKYPTTLDISRVCKLWKFLNKSSEMADLECDFTSNTVMEQFEDVFYGRIVDLCPAMQNRISSDQCRFLLVSFQLAIDNINDMNKLSSSLSSYAKEGYSRGIKSFEYSIIGDALFWSLSKFLERSYTRSLHQSLVKFYSLILRYILPVSVTIDSQMNEVLSLSDARLDDESLSVVLHAQIKPPPKKWMGMDTVNMNMNMVLPPTSTTSPKSC